MTTKIQEQFQLFLNNKCVNPKDIFGLFEVNNKKIIRFFLPDYNDAELEVQQKVQKATKIDENGLFELSVANDVTELDYQILYPFKKMYSPYSFNSTIKELDINLFNNGIHYELYKVLGSHTLTLNKIEGTVFRVWAPNAQKVTLLADFNNWDGRLFPLTKNQECGIWEIFIPFNCENQKYKYEIYTNEGHLKVKTDPFAIQYEKRPKTASIVHKRGQFKFEDELWLNKKENNHLNAPINIYEVHLGSWKKINEHEFSNYKTLAHELATYCKEMNFTHIEILPVMEHPLDESWGYQVTGFFAPTSRYGTFEDFQYFVNYMHSNQIGVILDWVPGHFPMDDFSLNYFDGTPLFEEKNPQLVSHPHWATSIFDYSSKQVCNFLIASALFWLEEMHVDGLRVDAVASLLYLDFGRDKDSWTSIHGSNLNLNAIEFIKHLNSVIHKRCNNKLMIAEESSAFEKVTSKVEEGGLGFDLKWKMGWMNDSLSYFATNPSYRKFKHNNLTFSMWYGYSEQFLLPLSHDEVVHEKKSLINKLNESEWIQFSNLRLLYSYMICHPGKKLIFMGAELGQQTEWNCKDQISWDLLDKFEHKAIQKMVKDINNFYIENDALWKYDFTQDKFNWVEVNDSDQSIISYLRDGSKKKLFCIHNCTTNSRIPYFVRIKNVESAQEVFNSDLSIYGGSNINNRRIDKITSDGFEINLAPMATMIFEVICKKS